MYRYNVSPLSRDISCVFLSRKLLNLTSQVEFLKFILQLSDSWYSIMLHFFLSNYLYFEVYILREKLVVVCIFLGMIENDC